MAILTCSVVPGRGVDINRNWAVDWGKKEKVLLMTITSEQDYAQLFLTYETGPFSSMLINVTSYCPALYVSVGYEVIPSTACTKD